MAETVKLHDFPIGQSQTTSATKFVGQHEQLIVYVSSVSDSMGSAIVKVSLLGAPASGVSAQTVLFYDYANKQPCDVFVTVPTAGFYELPYAGGIPYVKFQLDVATTQAVSIAVITPKTTY